MDLLAVKHARFWSITRDEEEALSTRFIDKINRFSRVEMKPDDVHVRGMWLCNDQLDSYYTQFSHSALDEIVELLPGAPVLTGHRWDSAPQATFFDAEHATRRLPGARKETHWAKGLFYLPRDADGDAFVRRIDAGVYREASIGFWCIGSSCSMCGGPYAGCRHWPGEVYDKGLASFTLDGITKVAEGSIVFRGAQQNTETFVPEGTRADRRAVLRTDAHREIREAFERDPEQRAKRDRGRRSSIVSVQMQADQFTKSDASRWLRDRDFRADKYAENGSSHVFEQRKAPADVETFSIQMDDGVSAVACREDDEREGSRSVSRGESLDELLAS